MDRGSRRVRLGFRGSSIRLGWPMGSRRGGRCGVSSRGTLLRIVGLGRICRHYYYYWVLMAVRLQ